MRRGLVRQGGTVADTPFVAGETALVASVGDLRPLPPRLQPATAPRNDRYTGVEVSYLETAGKDEPVLMEETIDQNGRVPPGQIRTVSVVQVHLRQGGDDRADLGGQESAGEHEPGGTVRDRPCPKAIDPAYLDRREETDLLDVTDHPGAPTASRGALP